MQTIKLIDIKKGKSGTSQHGEWQKYDMTFPELQIFDQTGTKFTFTRASTFDNCSALKAGDTIECEAEINDKYLNLKGLKKVGGSLTEAVNTNRETIAQTMPKVIEPRNTREQSIDEAVAIKAIVELACGNVIEKADPLVRAAKNWIADKLSHYLAPTQLSVEANKPSVGGTGDASVDKRMLLGLVKTNMKFTDDKTAIAWLVNVHKVSQSRIDNDAVNVYDEVREKQGWE